MLSWEYFETAAPKILENTQKNTHGKVPNLVKLQGYILQANSGLKILPKIFFWKCQERKRCSKISAISKKKSFAKQSLFSSVTGLQFRTSDLIKLGSKENISCECSKIVGNVPREGLYWSHFTKVTVMLSRIYILKNT